MKTWLAPITAILLIGGAAGIGAAFKAFDANHQLSEGSYIPVAILTVMWGCLVMTCYEIYRRNKKY